MRKTWFGKIVTGLVELVTGFTLIGESWLYLIKPVKSNYYTKDNTINLIDDNKFNTTIFGDRSIVLAPKNGFNVYYEKSFPSEVFNALNDVVKYYNNIFKKINSNYKLNIFEIDNINDNSRSEGVLVAQDYTISNQFYLKQLLAFTHDNDVVNDKDTNFKFFFDYNTLFDVLGTNNYTTISINSNDKRTYDYYYNNFMHYFLHIFGIKDMHNTSSIMGSIPTEKSIKTYSKEDIKLLFDSYNNCKTEEEYKSRLTALLEDNTLVQDSYYKNDLNYNNDNGSNYNENSNIENETNYSENDNQKNDEEYNNEEEPIYVIG